jgi:hypothetical protein
MQYRFTDPHANEQHGRTRFVYRLTLSPDRRACASIIAQKDASGMGNMMSDSNNVMGIFA